MESKSRNETIDIIRIFSLFFVVGVHFFLHSGFYKEPVVGVKMFLMSIARSFFIICVPMFLTLTGYLMNQKQLSWRYYKGILKTLRIYIICSIIYSLFLKYGLHQEMSIKIFIRNCLDYSGTQYAWYIEMYIGLFCLIPFLNLVFNNLKSRKQATALLLVLMAVVGLPGIINIYKISPPEWWSMPSTDKDYMQLIPSWWTSLYPIFYYYLGAYLSKYKLRMKGAVNAAVLAAVAVLDGLFNYYRSYPTHYILSSWNNYASASVMVLTFLTFALLLRIRFKHENKIRSVFLKQLSDACLGAYLLSCIFDSVYYNILIQNITNTKDRFIYAPIIVLASFVSSLLVSVIINLLYNNTVKIIKNLCQKIVHKPSVKQT